MSALLAFLHHVLAFTLVACIAVEFVLIRDEPTTKTARQLAMVDGVLGGSAGLLLVVGLLRVFFFEKGAAFYFSTATFIAKLAIFIILALLSVVPTRQFMVWRAAVRRGETPVIAAERLGLVRRILHLELIGAVLILLFAALMARGIG